MDKLKRRLSRRRRPRIKVSQRTRAACCSSRAIHLTLTPSAHDVDVVNGSAYQAVGPEDVLFDTTTPACLTGTPDRKRRLDLINKGYLLWESCHRLRR
jgi:hypothetical protein